MNRRELLKAPSMGAVVTASGLWFPGEKLISIPKIVTGNRLMTIDEITREMLLLYKQHFDHVTGVTRLHLGVNSRL